MNRPNNINKNEEQRYVEYNAVYEDTILLRVNVSLTMKECLR